MTGMAEPTETRGQQSLGFKSEKTRSNSIQKYMLSAVYVRYKDHVLFKHTQQPVAEAIERESIGWLAKQNGWTHKSWQSEGGLE